MNSSAYEALLPEFLQDAHERLGNVEGMAMSLQAADAEAWASAIGAIKREVHTLKGNAAMMGFADLQRLAHTFEEDLAGEHAPRDAGALLLAFVDQFRSSLAAMQPRDEVAEVVVRDTAAGSVRVAAGALDALMDLVAETVIVRNGLAATITAGRTVDPTVGDFESRSKQAWAETQFAYESLATNLQFLQERITRLRMVPLSTLFGTLSRIVHDESRDAGKSARLETKGGHTPLDKALLELANEVLGHLVRNAVVHGLEDGEARTVSGKSPEGLIRIVASARGEELYIEVSDDGAGIDPDQLRQTALDRGLDAPAPDDVYSVLFLPGFSTRSEADLSAGRGVGLSAVLEAVERHRGQIEIHSKVGVGSTFRLRLPLSVSIARVLLVRADGETYAVPLSTVVESRRLEEGERHEVNGAGVFTWRGQVLPLLDLGCAFGTRDALRECGCTVVIESSNKVRGLLLDDVIGIEEVVVKGLDPMLGRPPGVSGSTILGDGRAILILAPRELVTLEPFVSAAA